MADSVLRVLLKGDASSLNSSLKTASSRLEKFGGKMKAVGGQLQSFTLPLAIAGGAAIKMASDFDKSMTQIKSLVGVAGDEVDAMGEKAKALASEMGKSSNDAAEALFYITSAGLRGTEAMEVLEQSLKASAVGLGETKTVADLATSAMNAYGSETLSASGATDVLTAAVREGKLESSELASAMGSVLPTASNMGVQFYEVGAAMAAMSRTGTNASQAATQLNAILGAIMKPSTQATKALDELNLSSEGLRKQIKEKGLLSVLDTLKDASERNSTAFEMVFGNVRALRGILDLTGASAETTNQIFQRMENTMGMTNEAFETTAESASFKLNKALLESKNALTEIGSELLTTLLPYIKKLAQFVKDAVAKFDSWNDSQKESAIKLGALIIVLPTVLTALGNLTLVVNGLAKAFIALNGSAAMGGFKSLITKLPPQIAIFAAAIGGGVYAVSEGTKKIAPDVDVWERLAIAFGNTARQQSGLKNLSIEQLEKAQVAAKSLKESLEWISNNRPEPQSQDVTKEGPLTGMSLLSFSVPTTPTKKDKENTNQFVDNLAKDLENFELEQQIIDAEDIFSGTDLAFQLAAGEASVKSFANKISDAYNNIKENGKDVAESMTINFGQIGATIGQALATAVVNGDNIIQALGSAILGALGNLLVQIGQAAILASEAIKLAVVPTLGLAAGIAAVAFGTLLKGYSSKVKSGSFAAFANGGIVSSPTLGLVGEYAGARSNPEVIAPLDKLKSMIGDRGASNVNVTGAFRVQGQDLIVALERANKQKNRIG